MRILSKIVAPFVWILEHSSSLILALFGLDKESKNHVTAEELHLVVAEAHVPGRWVKIAAFPEPVEELYGAAAGGKVYVFGGLAPGWQPRGLVFEYDPATVKVASGCWPRRSANASSVLSTR